jgi:DNA sulfur modification protein DndD
MNIELTGWKSSGLRCPDVEFDLKSNGVVPKVTLIQMPNGTGKTTTLTMMRAVMTGEAETWQEDRVRAMRRPGLQNAAGVFAVFLSIEGKPLTLELRLDFDAGTATYRTSSPGLGGVVPGWRPPKEVERFLDERFVRLFIFDGEFADKLLQAGYSEAQKAIDALFQLYLLEEMKTKAQERWEAAAAKTSVKTESGLTMWRNKAIKLAASVSKVEKALADAKTRLKVLEPEIEDLDRSIRDRIGSQEELRNKLDAAREREVTADFEVAQRAVTTMGLVRQPHTLFTGFASRLVDMKAQLDRLKLPASTSSQFFAELLEEDHCVCGRPLDDTARGVLNERAALYLADDTSGVLNWMKKEIESNVIQTGSADAATLSTALDEMGDALAEASAAATAVRALRQKLVEQGDEQLKKDEEALEQRRDSAATLSSLIAEMSRAASTTDDEGTKCLLSLKKQLADASGKVAEITGTIDLLAKTNVLKGILTTALETARARLRAVILSEINARLKQVLYRDPIEVDSIDSSVRLRHQEGASVGQTLSVGYVFLTTLLRRGQHQFPLVIDSPANPLSIEVRREIGRVIPDLCHQFVAFTISSERVGFVRPLDEAAKGNIRYLTQFRKTGGTAALMGGLPKVGVTESENGVVIEGREYFEAFDLEEEI